MAETKQYITQTNNEGAIMISEDVIASIVIHALSEVEGVVGLTNKLGADIYQMIGMGNRSKSIKVEIGPENDLSVYCDITIAYGHCVVTVAKAAQVAIAGAVEAISGVKSTSVNINVSGVVRV